MTPPFTTWKRRFRGLEELGDYQKKDTRLFFGGGANCSAAEALLLLDFSGRLQCQTDLTRSEPRWAKPAARLGRCGVRSLRQCVFSSFFPLRLHADTQEVLRRRPDDRRNLTNSQVWARYWQYVLDRHQTWAVWANSCSPGFARCDRRDSEANDWISSTGRLASRVSTWALPRRWNVRHKERGGTERRRATHWLPKKNGKGEILLCTYLHSI
jgi:hypothetical protein